jgi:hypothetical protein
MTSVIGVSEVGSDASTAGTDPAAIAAFVIAFVTGAIT